MARTLARRYLLLPHKGPGEAQLLMLPSPDGWTCPFVDLERHSAVEGAPLVTAVRVDYGVDIALLRTVYRHAAEPGDYADLVIAVEILPSAWAPPAGSRWVTAAELELVDLAIPEHRAVIKAWFVEETGRVASSSRRSPWAKPGWFSDVVTWIDDQLGCRSIQRTGPVEQVKNWSVSCLLKLPTSVGELWFKAVPVFFPGEVGVTATLAAEFPAQMPRLVAVDRERGWMLMHAFEGGLLRDELDVERWEDALRAYAGMQVWSVDRVDDLLAAGCNDRRFPVMFAQFEQLLADDEFLGAALRPEEVVRLRDLLPELKALAAGLEATGIPCTLEHGDLHCRNVSSSLRFFDWSDACVAHPFFSLDYFLAPRGAAVEQTVGLKERLVAAYLAPWARFVSPEQLRIAVVSASRLANVHYALSYYWYIAPLSDDDWTDMVALYLRELLA
ncbi:MAG TPA: hypothetical protein VK464_00115 [Symbiobacteriaceae bacterium]|nr:hypothetical protein [Symbiobacteriaceae bacterium]